MRLKRCAAAIVAAIMFIMGFNINIYAKPLAEIQEGDMVVVEGSLGSESSNAAVTLLLKKDSAVGHIAQLKTDDRGNYSYSFLFRENAEDYKLYLKEGITDVTNTLSLVKARPVKLIASSVINGKYNIQAELSGLPEEDFVVIVAFYDETRQRQTEVKTIKISKDKIKNGKVSLNEKLETLSTSKYVNVFFWDGAEKMVSVATNDNVFAGFGNKLEKLYEEGYGLIDGANNYEAYLNAKAELPDEVPIISPSKPKGEYTIFVSPDGDDTASGDISAPLKTIEEALRREELLSKSTVIYLREGRYFINEPINITNAHSNSKKSLYISAYEDENVSIGYGAAVSGNKFTKVTAENTDYDRIPNPENTYAVSYADIGIESMAGFAEESDIPTLTFNNKKMQIARYPDVGWDYVEEVIKNGLKWTDWGGWRSGGEAEFVPEDKTVVSWKNTGNIWLWGMFSVPWYGSNAKVKIDTAAKTISSNKLSAAHKPIDKILLYESAGRSHFYYYNALEALNCKGEWFADDDSQILYFIPPNGELKDSDVIKFQAKDSQAVFNVENADNLVFDKLEIEFSKNGIAVNGGHRVIIQGCVLSNIIENAVSLNNTRRCGITGSSISNSYIGCKIDGSPAADNIWPYQNFIQNTHINNVERTGIDIRGAYGNIVSHNLIENIVGDGISVIGTENIIEYNELTMCVLQGVEGSGIYINGNRGLFTRSNHIRYNYIHDFRNPEYTKSIPPLAVTDDIGENNYFYGNLLVNGNSGYSINGGDNHIVENNVFINCKSSSGAQSYYYNHTDLIDAVLTDKPQTVLSKRLIKRYGTRITDKLDAMQRAAAVWNTASEEDKKTWCGSEEIRYLCADTGNYYVNNICVNSSLPSPSKPYGINKNVTDVDIQANPSAKITSDYGMEYNLTYGNQEISDYNIGENEVFKNAGLANCSEIFKTDKSLYISGIQRNEETIIVSWLPSQGANYYKVEISNDENGENIVRSFTTNETSASFDTDVSERYITVTGISTAKDKTGTVSKSEIIKIH